MQKRKISPQSSRDLLKSREIDLMTSRKLGADVIGLISVQASATETDEARQAVIYHPDDFSRAALEADAKLVESGNFMNSEEDLTKMNLLKNLGRAALITVLMLGPNYFADSDKGLDTEKLVKNSESVILKTIDNFVK